MITEATLRFIKYPPELIPDSWFGDVPLNAEVSPPILDLRRFKPYVLILTNIQTTQPAGYANVLLRARYNDARVEENVAALPPLLVGAWQLLAKDYLFLNFFGQALVPDYTTHFGLWVRGGSPTTPTVAEKLLYGIPLSSEEREIAERYGISNTVEKGLLPLPISSQIEREYHIIGEETHSRNIDIAGPDTVYTLESIYPREGEFIVLTRLAAEPSGVANNVRLIVDRDDDAGYAGLKTYALSLDAGGEVSCFIPAMREIRLTTIATAAPGPHLFRYTFQTVKMNNILRARFGLVSKDEIPGETYEKVKGGIL